MGDSKIRRIKGGLVIDRPGRVLFVPVKADGTLDWVNAIRNTAVINTINITNSRTTTDIPDGNNMYPAGNRTTAITGTVAIEFSTVDAEIWAMASGSGLKENESDSMLQIYDYDKIDETTGKITLNDVYKTNGYIDVIGSDGTKFEKASSTPQGNEYSVSSEGGQTVLTFNTADKGKDVAITMEITASTISYSQGGKPMKNHKIIISTEYSTVNDVEKIPVNVEVSQASLSADMVDALVKDPSSTKTLTFNMLAPRPGEKPYNVKMLSK